MESLNSNESSVVSCDVESVSNVSVEKPLSPVLSVRKITRRKFLGRKLNNQNSKVKLVNRFEGYNPIEESQKESAEIDRAKANKLFNQHDTIEDRMRKIKQLEIERKQYYNQLTDERSKKDSQTADTGTEKDKSEFKKPLLPLPNFNHQTSKQSSPKNLKSNAPFNNLANDKGTKSNNIREVSGRNAIVENISDNANKSIHAFKCDSTLKQPMKAKARQLSKIPRPNKNYPNRLEIKSPDKLTTATTGFKSASGKCIDIAENQVNALKGIFSDENFDDILFVTPSNKRVMFKTPSGKNLVITESLISMADKMITGNDDKLEQSTVSSKHNLSMFSTNTMNKLFTNDKFDQFSTSTTNSLDIFGYTNSFETPSDFTRSSFYHAAHTESFSTVHSSNLIKYDEEERKYFSRNECMVAISDTQSLVAADDASAIDNNDWINENEVDHFDEQCRNESVVTHVDATNEDIDKNDYNDYDPANEPKLTDNLAVVTLTHSQPQVGDDDDEDDFSVNTQEINLCSNNFVEPCDENSSPKEDAVKVHKIEDSNGEVQEEIEQKQETHHVNHSLENSPNELVRGISSKNVINLCVAPSLMACQAEMMLSKKLVELHKNQNFIGNSEDSFCGFTNVDYKISEHSVEVRQKTLTSQKTGCEGFTKCEQKAAEEKLYKIVKNIKKIEKEVQEKEKDTQTKLRADKRMKNRKSKKQTEANNTLIDVIEEEGDENVIEQEEHPNTVAAMKDECKKSKRKKEKPIKHNKCKSTVHGCDGDVPVLKKIKHELKTQQRLEEMQIENPHKTIPHVNANEIPMNNCLNVHNKFYEKTLKSDEIQSTITYDHVSIISEKSCKKYKSHKKRKSTDLKETNKELVHSSPAKQSFELNSNPRKFKIEIDCTNKFHINISCNGGQHDKINVIDNGGIKLTQKAIEDCVVPENKSPKVSEEEKNNQTETVSQNTENVDTTIQNLDTSAKDDKSNKLQNNGKIDQKPFPDYCSLGLGKEKLFKKILNKAHKIYKDIKKSDVSLNTDKGTDKSKELESLKNKTSPEMCNESSNKARKFKSIENKKLLACGFKSASGKDIDISEDVLKKARNFYDKIKNEDYTNETIYEETDDSFNKQQKNPQEVTDGVKNTHNMEGDIQNSNANVERRTRVLYQDLKSSNLMQPPMNGFVCASGKPIKISEEAVKKSERFFNDIDALAPNEYLNSKNVNDKLLSINAEGCISPHELNKHDIFDRNAKVRRFNEINNYNFLFDNKTLSGGDYKKDYVVGFMSAAGKKVDIKQEALKKAEKTFEEFKNVDLSRGDFEDHKRACSPDVSKMCEYRIESGNKYSQSESKTIDGTSTVTATPSKRAFELLEDVVSTVDSALEKIKCNDRLSRSTNSRKRLGISRSRQIAIPKEKLEQAKLLFEEDGIFNSSYSTNKSPSKSPNIIHNSTPARNKQFMLQNVVSPDKFLLTSNLTPIKVASRDLSDNEYQDTLGRSTLVIHPKTEGGIDKWQNDLTDQIKELKKRLTLLGERKRGLEIQKDALGVGHKDYRRQKIGSLYKLKHDSRNHLCLKNLQQSISENVTVSEDILKITPKNSEFIHFPARSLGKQEIDVEKTIDEALVVPNVKDLIGVSEIECAFKTMSGVDHTLIPRGWVLNHYRLIVWKLASYERFFPVYLKGCLSVDNVIQQLKYRYDREIDRAQRPAIRKILEKDDVPQKRMILCVSDIYQVNEKSVELELTDGWYCLKTVIDDLLVHQVLKKKIKVGTKLLIQGAELLNCDGCHPLEVPEHVKLKISYNSTRRAIWHSKLGYQSNPGPFLIQMKTIHPNGGMIGCIKIQVARVYPIRYMEQIEDIKIWRNGKAEEKRKKVFEAERINKIEKIRLEVQKDEEKTAAWENKNRSLERSKLNKTEISKITCAKTLYNIIKNSNDPDSIMEMLSHSQRAIIVEYRQTMSVEMEYDTNVKIAQQVEKFKLLERKVIPMLKLLVLDSNDVSDKAYTFCIWKPTPEHEEMLKEDTTFTVYNVVPRSNGDFVSNSKTYFKFERKFSSTHTKLKRQVFPIAMTLDMFYCPAFYEFDTVGIVVQLNIKSHDQDLWMADFLGRLLFVKIKESPKCCSLLDGITRSNIITLSNLVYCKPQKEFGQAIANQFTVVTMYPQQRFLQESLEVFKIQLPKDIVKLLDDCDKRIEKCIACVDVKQNYSRSVQHNSLLSTTNNISAFLDDSLEDSTVIPSRLTSTDVLMSLIDTDQFN